MVQHACPCGKPVLQECQEVGINLILGFSLSPLCSCAPAPVLLSSNHRRNLKATITNQLFLSIAVLSSNFPQGQPLASFSPHFTHSAKFPRLLCCSSSPVPLPVWCLKVGLCVLQRSRQSCGIFRQQLHSPTRCGLETNHSLHVVPEQSGSCAQPIPGQAGHWQPCLFYHHSPQALRMPAKLLTQRG